MNPSFEKQLLLKKVCKIFESGTMDEKIEFCKEFLEKNQTKNENSCKDVLRGVVDDHVIDMENYYLVRDRQQTGFRIVEVKQSIPSLYIRDKEGVQNIRNQIVSALAQKLLEEGCIKIISEQNNLLDSTIISAHIKVAD